MTYYLTLAVILESQSLSRSFSELKAVTGIIQGNSDPYPLTVKFDVSLPIGALPISFAIQNTSVTIARISKNNTDYAAEGAKLLD